TGNVVNIGPAAAGSYTGGLVGINGDGYIYDSYATGQVTGVDPSITGSLVGYNSIRGSISDSYYNAEANSGLPGVGGSDASSAADITNINGLDSSQIDSQFGEQIQQGYQQADDAFGLSENARSENQESLSQNEIAAGLWPDSDASVNEALGGAESDWQSGQADRDAAIAAPEDSWQSEIDSRGQERQAELSELAAIQTAEFRTQTIQTTSAVTGGTRLNAEEAALYTPHGAETAGSTADPQRAGEFISGAGLNGLAGDTYSYGVEQVDVGTQRFTTDVSRPDSGDGSEDEEEEEK
ncbi:MAG: hypothetical protein LBK52_04125, partial [Deltaproteobacteria bacterium]|nr:hypothetical protein [Deltaproteobacteria bacterium]